MEMASSTDRSTGHGAGEPSEATELEHAVQEVDRSLLRWSLGLTASERLRVAVRNGRLLARLRRARA